jgi:hypothetical protein
MANRPRLEEWQMDLVRNVGTDLVRDIVNDFRSYNPHPAQDPNAKVTVQGAGRVVTGDDGPAHRPLDRSGWQEPPKVDSWRPPGVDICDELMDQQDRIDKAQRIRELAEAAAVQRALKPAEPKEQEPKAREESKDRGGKKA